MGLPVQPPIEVWELLRNPILTFYQDGMVKGIIEGILPVISNSCHAKKHWYVPFLKGNGYHDQETQSLREEQHTAFCTWLLGRLFCILGRDSLADIHASCVTAQIEILQVCSENQFMISFFFSEYTSCLSDLVLLQTSEAFLSNGPQLLKRFTPLHVKDLENLNLTPKYILIKSEALVFTLEKYLVQIIDSMLAGIVLSFEDLVGRCWTVLCQLMQISPPHLNLVIFQTFMKMIFAGSCCKEPLLADLCHTLKAVTLSSSQSTQDPFQGGSESVDKQALLSGVGDLINVIISSECCEDNIPRLKDLLTLLHSVIIEWNITKENGPGLETACKNVIKLLFLLPYGSINPDIFCFLLRRYETQEFAVHILEKCLCDEVVNHIKSSSKCQSLLKSEKIPKDNSQFSFLIDAVLSLPFWTSLSNQIWEEVTTMQADFSNNPSRQTWQEVNDLVGKLKSLVRCVAGVDMLFENCEEAKKIRPIISFFPQKINNLIGFCHFVIQQLVNSKSCESTMLYAETIIKSIISAVRFIYLLPEVLSSELDICSELVVSIVVIPWIGDIGVRNVEASCAKVPGLYPDVKCDEMKIISLNSLVNILYSEAEFWKSSVFGRIMNVLDEPVHEKLVVEAILALPALLLDPSQQQAELLNNILFPALQSNSETIVTAVSDVFSSIVCVLSGDVAATVSSNQEGILKRSYVCLTCQKDFPGSSVGAQNVLNRYQDILNSFVGLLTCRVVAVRQNMAASLGSLVLHLPAMYNTETVQTLMKYAEDEDKQVRLKFSGMVKFLIFSRDWMEGKGIESEFLREEHIPLTQVDRVELSHSRPRLEFVLQLLKSGILSRLRKKTSADSDIQETLLATIVDIGCVPLDCVLVPVLEIVLTCVSHPGFSHPSSSQVYLKQIAIAHNTNVVKLYQRFQSHICQVLVHVMAINFHARPLWTKFMDKVVESFGFESTSAWLQQSLKHIFPVLMVLVVKFKDTAFLTKIIELLSRPAASVIKDNFEFIYPYVFLNESDQIVEECVKLMEEMSGTSAQQLIITSFKTIHSEFLLHYYSKKERVEKGICQLIEVLEKEQQTSQKLQHTSQQAIIAKHLEQRFLGVLVHFDCLLESTNCEESSKINVLQSLPQIIRLMGPKYITPVRFKLLSTLRTALRLTHCDFPHLSCGAWEAFIRSVDIPELGPLLGTVAASLLPLLDQFPDEISSMLEWLVEKFEYELSEYIPDLFFLPDTPALHKVNKIVQQHVAKKLRVLNESQKLVDFLQQPLRFITHDNVDIRRHGLENLLSLLKEKQIVFTQSLLQEEVVHVDVAKLLSLLIEGCRDTDKDIQHLCVQNLGVLGALDPGHLPRQKPEIAMPQIISVDEDRFAVQALTALAKAYQAARNTRYLDSFAVAIQDLLRLYKISSQSSQSRKNLWDAFPSDIQQVMAPLENSSYYMTTMQSNYVWPHPLFGTRHAVTLNNWAHSWACRIVKFIVDTKAKDIFTLCIPSLRRDINCVLFFLPFILLYAVISSQEDHLKMIVEEMSFIIQQHSLKEAAEESASSSDSEKLQIKWDKSVNLVRVADSDSATHVLCAKTVFTLLDFMDKWVGWSEKKMRSKRDGDDAIANIMAVQVQNVQKFLSEFSKLDLAHGNYGVKEYARALMYLEDYLMENKELLKDEEHLSFLGRIYAQLNEPDGIKGVLAIQCSQPKLLEAVVYHEVAGQYQEALACYELLAKEHSNDALGARVTSGMIRCCLSLDQPYAALHIAEGALSKKSECPIPLLEAQAECFWRINDFDRMEALLKDPQLENSNVWEVSIGRCFMDILHDDQTSLQEHLSSTRSYLSKALSTASLENGCYLQGYPHVIKLHVLQEIDEASKVTEMIRKSDVSEQCCINAVGNLVKVWKDRLALVQAASPVQEPLLRLQRCLLQLASSFVKESQYDLMKLIEQEVGTSWLKSAEVARIAECYQQAYIYLLNAEKYRPKRLFIELAKLHWVKKEQDHALATLRRGLDQHFPNSKEFKNMAADCMVDERKICAEAKWLVATYNDLNMNVDTDLNISNYRSAVDVYQHWEKSHAALARYYDRISVNDVTGQNDVFQRYAIESYIKSLRFGCSFIYHSMSRMLTIWLDYGKKYHNALVSKQELPKKVMIKKKETMDRMNTYIESHVNILPTYMFMTGFSQLVSRMCHPVAEVYGVIKTIIVKLLQCYPQQTLWMLVAMNRSSYALRKFRCKGILEDSTIKRTPALSRLTSDFEVLGQHLAELCQKPVSKELQRTSVSFIARNLPKLLNTPGFSNIMMPMQHCRVLNLPQQELSSLLSHCPFPVQVPYIVGIKEEVTILSSLQRPRKVTFKGSDGQYYDMMCKNKDDLRLDARVMEFNSIVNKYLQKDPASRSRNLNIRTYSVVPLNEDCGLIEWVPNIMPFRVIVSDIYKEKGIFVTTKEIRKFILDKDAKFQVRKDSFLKDLLPRHPPVFQHWFRKNFTDSHSWFEARKSYVHTLAVMSMVGYILGLGDRHGENICLDTTSGDAVHVDFNCLFNRGEKFECPERVPFRLTQNMVAAMGPTGVEGPFRIACEITLQLLRESRETLLSVLQPFVYDPKSDETRNLVRRVQSSKTDQDEVTNDSAVENVRNIDQRLNGVLIQQGNIVHLSVEGHAHFLIQEATSTDNLCQMYIGWGSYL